MTIIQRSTILVAILAAAAFGVTLPGSMQSSAAEEQAQNSEGEQGDLAAQIIGTWRLEQATTPGSPSGVGTRLKFFTGTHWSIVQPDPDTGVIVFQHGGSYAVDGNKLKTTRDFAGESTRAMIGTSGTFEVHINGDTMQQADANGVFNETWKRLK